MSKKLGIILVILGAALLAAALLLILHNRQESDQAGQQAETALADVQAVIAENTNRTASQLESDSAEAASEVSHAPRETDAPLSQEMPVVTVDGYDYVGYVSIPALELELPVMAQWDDDRLSIAPCRQFGSSRTDDLVIAGHNYASHFGSLKELEVGDRVIFTDAEGMVNHYAVAGIDTVSPLDVEAVQNSGYDLVLYTCTVGGQTRVVVLCNRTAEPS